MNVRGQSKFEFKGILATASNQFISGCKITLKGSETNTISGNCGEFYFAIDTTAIQTLVFECLPNTEYTFKDDFNFKKVLKADNNDIEKRVVFFKLTKHPGSRKNKCRKGLDFPLDTKTIKI